MARLSGKIRPDFVEKSGSGQILKTLIRYIPSEKHIYFKVLFTAKNIIVKADSALRIIVSYIAVSFIAVIFQWALKLCPINDQGVADNIFTCSFVHDKYNWSFDFLNIESYVKGLCYFTFSFVPSKEVANKLIEIQLKTADR